MGHKVLRVHHVIFIVLDVEKLWQNQKN